MKSKKSRRLSDEHEAQAEAFESMNLDDPVAFFKSMGYKDPEAYFALMGLNLTDTSENAVPWQDISSKLARGSKSAHAQSPEQTLQKLADFVEPGVREASKLGKDKAAII